MSDPIERVAPAYELVSFTQYDQPGFIVAERHPEWPDAFNIYPLIGWALWEVTDEEGTYREVQPVTNDAHMDWIPDAPILPVYYSRTLFRQSQALTGLTVSRTSLDEAVSKNDRG